MFGLTLHVYMISVRGHKYIIVVVEYYKMVNKKIKLGSKKIHVCRRNFCFMVI